MVARKIGAICDDFRKVNHGKLLDQMKAKIRTFYYSIRTESAYLHWAKRFILFHGKTHPAEMGEKEVGAFLTHLAAEAERGGLDPESGAQYVALLVRGRA